jgi:predicted nuclease of predicted toxin-antitoxin system
MSVAYYFDEHLAMAVAKQLRKKGYQVVRSVEVNMTGADDDTGHLPYATQNQLVMVTFDREFAGRITKRTDFYGLVCLSEKYRRDYGKMIEVLEEFAQLFEPEKDTGIVYWL